MNVYGKITGQISAPITIAGNLASAPTIQGSLTVPTAVGGVYGGPYEVTPTEEAQVLPTNNLYSTENITIQAIPANYGRITWNGSIITVS